MMHLPGKISARQFNHMYVLRMLNYGQEAEIEGIFRILMKCLYDNVEELVTDLDSTRSVQ
jgi:hypothetical protein